MLSDRRGGRSYSFGGSPIQNRDTFKNHFRSKNRNVKMVEENVSNAIKLRMAGGLWSVFGKPEGS